MIDDVYIYIHIYINMIFIYTCIYTRNDPSYLSNISAWVRWVYRRFPGNGADYPYRSLWAASRLPWPSVAMTIRRNRGSRDAQTKGKDLRTVVFGEIDVGWRINVEHLHIWHDLSVNELDSKTGVPWGLTCAMCTLPNSFHFGAHVPVTIKDLWPSQRLSSSRSSESFLQNVGLPLGDVLQSSRPFRATPWAQLGIWFCCTLVSC